MRIYLRHEGPRSDRPGAAACRNEWAGAYLPMDRMALSELLRGSRCPVCGGGNDIRVVDAREMTAHEALQAP